jgi:LPS sulfotransferase NodH
VLSTSLAAQVFSRVAPQKRSFRKSLFIASEVRCGSTFIAETLAYELNQNLGFQFWDLAQERFSDLDDHSTAEDALRAWRELYLDGSGFVASKIMCKALSVLHRLARQSEAVREAFFGEDAHWIVLRRNDRVEQAVSLALASKTQTYHFYDDPAVAPDRDATLTPDEVDWAFKAVALSDVYLEVFAKTAPIERKLAFEYHEFLDDQVGCLNRVHELCGFKRLHAPSYVNLSKIRRTGGAVKRQASEAFKAWFLENHV